MEFLLEGVKQYQTAWNSAIDRARKINDDSDLNDPLYRISKLASTRSYGEKDGFDLTKIIMFMSSINPFVGLIKDLSQYYDVV